MTLIISVLKNPSLIRQFSTNEWNSLVCQARASNLLGRLHYHFDKNKLTTEISENILWHFSASRTLSERIKKNTLREIEELNITLSAKGVTPIFLKGGAYYAAEISCSEGRIMSDIDILVPKSSLSNVQSTLLFDGWVITPMDNYDQMYYRKWMHEIPPITHVKRKTCLDIHHNILPLTNINVPLANKLNTRNINNSWCGNILTLDKLDTIIHSAVHLFTESEFHHGLRDLSDLDMLIRDFSTDDSTFIEKLIDRANELGLSMYVWLALRYTAIILATPIENTAKEKLQYQPASNIHQQCLDFCFINIFKPNHSSCRDWKMSVAEFLLYWRGHLLKMPLRILIPHLARKSWMRFRDHFKKDDKPAEFF